MNNRVLINIMLLVLFAITQTGIAMHEVTHIDPEIAHTQSELPDQNKNTFEAHCDHCIAQADSDTADIPQTVDLKLSHAQHLLATITVANLVSRLSNRYSPRAPPTV